MAIQVKQTEKNDQKRKKKPSAPRFVQCKFCDITIVDKAILYHMRTNHAKEFKNSEFHCEVCNLNFLTARSLRSHNGLKHPMSTALQQETYECDFDGKVFQYKSNFSHHMRTHLPKIECKICNKMFRVSSIDGHMKETHATGNKFQCKICPKSFKVRHLLTTHEKIHDKKFQCEICNMKFAARTRLRQHIARVHENPGSYQCEICNKIFNEKSSLKSHQKTHERNRPKPYKCSKCDYAVDVKYTLKNHQKVHERLDKKIAAMKNPLKCEKCPTVCKDKKSLKNHYRVVHPTNLFQCDLCGKFIKYKSSIKEHILMHLRKMSKITQLEQ